MGLEEVDEVVEDLCGTLGSRDARDQDGCEKGAGVNIKVGAGGGEVLESLIGERGVCCDVVEEEGDEEEEDGGESWH